MKTILRLLVLLICLSGWAVVMLCVHVVRVPDAANHDESKFVVVPKNRLELDDTYVDARGWHMSDVKNHPLVVLRLLRAGKAADLSYLADSNIKKDVETQITEVLDGESISPDSSRAGSTSRSSPSPRKPGH